ncbi:MAG: nucleotide sugar dehydrogenase [Dongiaceae bacterium]
MTARIAVVGLGPVGSVSAACLAAAGHAVVGIDRDAGRAGALAAGRAPVHEPGLDELVAAGIAAGRLTAGDDLAAAVAASDLSLICVATPAAADGTPDHAALAEACRAVGRALRRDGPRHTVVVRSTVPPGTTRSLVVPLLEQESGRRLGAGLGVAVHPEFLREGSALADFRAAERRVVGCRDAASGDAVAALYAGDDPPPAITTIEIAEAVKYADNAWHALKVAFANEVAGWCAAEGVDGLAVMALLRQDRRLNLSAAYLEPGLPFGGACLGKDLRTLGRLAERRGLELPVLAGILPSNRRHLERLTAAIAGAGHGAVAILGLAVKTGTDDLRDSPALALAAALQAQGCRVRLYDRLLRRGPAAGRLGPLAALLQDDAAAALDGATFVVLGNRDQAYRRDLAGRPAATLEGLLSGRPARGEEPC